MRKTQSIFFIAMMGTIVCLSGVLHSDNGKEEAQRLIRQLKDSDPSVRGSAAYALGNLGEHAKGALLQLVDTALKDSDSSVRRSAADALESLGEHAKGALPQLVEALKDSDSSVRGRAVVALGRLGEHAKEALPQLAEALKDSDLSVRWGAANALGELGEHAKGALLQLAEALKDSDPSVRRSAASALGRLGEHAKGALPQLADALKDSDPSMRRHVAYALGRFGKHAKGALPQLVDTTLKDSDPSVRWSALDTLESLRKYFPEEIDRLFKEKLPSATADMCRVLCGLVDKSNSWIGEHYTKPDVGFHEKTFGFSLLSLSALFLSKASPFCSAAKPVIKNIIAHLSRRADQKPETSQGCPADAFPFEKLQTFATDVLKMTASPLDSPQVYGKQFLTLFLRDALRRSDITDFQREQVTALLKETEDSLAHDLKVRPTSSGGGGSLFNTYALSTTLLTLQQNNDEEMRLLGEAIDPDDALRIKYSGDSPFDSQRGSAARAVPAHLARYVKLPKKERDSARGDLISAIKNYVNHLPSLMAHLQRGDTHVGQDSLAPYYLYATIPYQTAAIELLLEEGKPEEREMLEEMRKETKSAILGLVRPDGQFYVPEYESSPGYVNPLFGLALIPLAKDCAAGTLDQQDLHGILVREIP